MCVTVVACVGVSISSHIEYGHVKEDVCHVFKMWYLSPIDYRGIFVVAHPIDWYVFNLYKSHCVCV